MRIRQKTLKVHTKKMRTVQHCFCLHVTYLMWQLNTYSCCFFNGIFFFTFVRDKLDIKKLGCDFNNSFLVIKRSFRWSTFCECKHMRQFCP
jgi:hypothetical protein